MDALGRFFAVMLGAVGLVLLLFFHRTATLMWQKNETVRSMSHGFAEQILRECALSEQGVERFRETLEQMGEYEVTVSVFERRRYENEEGRLYLYVESKETDGEVSLLQGSYVRIVVKEKERSKVAAFLYGDTCVVYAGGRVS